MVVLSGRKRYRVLHEVCLPNSATAVVVEQYVWCFTVHDAFFVMETFKQDYLVRGFHVYNCEVIDEGTY